MVRRNFGACLLLAMALGLSGGALAFESGPSGVGRISFIEGTVEVGETGTDAGYEAAAINYPVAPGSRIRADQGARAEIRVGLHALRLEGPAVLDAVELEHGTSQFWLPEGALNARLGELPADGSFAVATPWANVLIRAAGSYRIDADPHAGHVQIAVRSGEARVSTEAGEMVLRSGRIASASGNGLMEYEGSSAYGDDDLDRWSMSREAEEPAAASAGGYVPPDVTGYEQLQRYGSWTTDPTYGPVWAPGSDYSWWSPYQHGQWGWVPSWGWSWVDHAPWAFTTFRLGQWVFVGSRWFWAPGHFVHRPILSAFVPFRPGQIIFTTPFFFHGKPAVNHVPLHPRKAFGASRPRHGAHGHWSAGAVRTIPQGPARQAPGSFTRESGVPGRRLVDGLPPPVVREPKRAGGFISTPGGVTVLPGAGSSEPRTSAPAGAVPVRPGRAAVAPGAAAPTPIGAPGAATQRGEAAARHGFRGGRPVFGMEARPPVTRAWAGVPAPQVPARVVSDPGLRGEAGFSHRRGHREGNATAHGQGRGMRGAAGGAPGGHWRSAGQRR